MNSLTSEEDISILRKEERESDGCLYRYRLQRTAALPIYTVTVSFCGTDGYTTEQALPLPFADAGKAQAMFERIVHALVTPIDLPYVLEDHFAV